MCNGIKDYAFKHFRDLKKRALMFRFLRMASQVKAACATSGSGRHKWEKKHNRKKLEHGHSLGRWLTLPPNHLLLDGSPNIGPLISRWELDKFKICWNKSFRTSKLLTLLYQQVLNLFISQRDMSGPRLGALPNNRWSGVSSKAMIVMGQI
jgi:hypothetical protein